MKTKTKSNAVTDVIGMALEMLIDAVHGLKEPVQIKTIEGVQYEISVTRNGQVMVKPLQDTHRL